MLVPEQGVVWFFFLIYLIPAFAFFEKHLLASLILDRDKQDWTSMLLYSQAEQRLWVSAIVIALPGNQSMPINLCLLWLLLGLNCLECNCCHTLTFQIKLKKPMWNPCWVYWNIHLSAGLCWNPTLDPKGCGQKGGSAWSRPWQPFVASTAALCSSVCTWLLMTKSPTATSWRYNAAFLLGHLAWYFMGSF